MNTNRLFTALIVAASMAFMSPVMAQATTPAAPAAPAAPGDVVETFTTLADMPGIADINQKNTYKVSVTDKQVATVLTLTCQAGGSKFIIMSQPKACAISGNGAVINPKNQAKLPRTQYQGGFTVQPNGNTDATQIQVNYLALGSAAASSAPFGGALNLKPQATSGGSQALIDSLMNKFTSDNKTGAVIDKRTDTVEVEGLTIPSAGFPTDTGTVWNGSMVFSYQTNSWYIDLKATNGGKDYAFKGNMPWTDTPNVSNQTQYDITLTEPSANIQGDDALFSKPTDNSGNDLFATVDGIHGTITMKQSDMVTVKIDGKDTETPARVDASGTIIGTNVPADVVRSFAIMFGMLSDNFFGA